MTTSRRRGEGELTGWHVLAIMVASFGVIIGVNIALAIAATGTFPGLVVENSYVASQHYDELLASARAQDEKGWRPKLGAEGGVLRFSLSRSEGEPLRGLSVIAHVGRPSTTVDDRIFDLVVADDGSYVATAPLPPGVWEVDLEAGHGADTLFRKTQEIFIRPPETRP